MRWVIDASAAVEFLFRSKIGLAVEGVLGEADTIAPELIDAEVLAVVRRLTLAGKLPAERAEEALDDLNEWEFERVPHRKLLSFAWELRHNVSAYDALYVSAARSYDAQLLTADGPLSRAASMGIVVHNVQETIAGDSL